MSRAHLGAKVNAVAAIASAVVVAVVGAWLWIAHGWGANTGAWFEWFIGFSVVFAIVEGAFAVVKDHLSYEADKLRYTFDQRLKDAVETAQVRLANEIATTKSVLDRREAECTRREAEIVRVTNAAEDASRDLTVMRDQRDREAGVAQARLDAARAEGFDFFPDGTLGAIKMRHKQ